MSLPFPPFGWHRPGLGLKACAQGYRVALSTGGGLIAPLTCSATQLAPPQHRLTASAAPPQAIV